MVCKELKNLAYIVKSILSANVSMADFMRDDWIKFNNRQQIITKFNLCTVMCVRSRSQKITHGYAIIAISPGNIEAPRIQIAI